MVRRKADTVIRISAKARDLLDRDLARVRREVGGQPSRSKIADRIIIEALERKDGK